MQTTNASMRYTKSLTPIPTVAMSILAGIFEIYSSSSSSYASDVPLIHKDLILFFFISNLAIISTTTLDWL